MTGRPHVMTGESTRSSSKEQRIIASFSHLLILATPFALALVIWLSMYVTRSRPYAQFQAAQATLYQLVVANLIAVIGLVGFFVGYQRFGINLLSDSDMRGVVSGGSTGEQAVLAFIIFMGLLTVATYAYSVYASILTYRGRPFRMPVISNIAAIFSPMPDTWTEEG